MEADFYSIRKALRGSVALSQTLGLKFEDFSIVVAGNEQDLLAVLEDYYREFTTPVASQPDIFIELIEAAVREVALPFKGVPPSGAKKKVKDEILDFPEGRFLRKRFTGMIFAIQGESGLAVGPCRENINQVINFINNRFIQWKVNQGYLLTHAAGASHHGRAIAIAGESGRGKSTLTLQLLNYGLDYMSNDRLLVRLEHGTLHAQGLPKYPRVNPGTLLHNPTITHILPEEKLAEFQAMPAEKLWTLEQKYDVDVERCFGPGRMKLSGELAGIVILNWTREDPEPMRVEETRLMDRRDLLRPIMKSLGAHYFQPGGRDLPDESEEAFLTQLSQCPIYEITGALDFRSAAVFCMKLMRQPSVA